MGANFMNILKVAIVVLAGTDTYEGMGRVANALVAVQEYKEAGDDVQLIFDGAGVGWPPELSKSNHLLHGLYQSVRDKIIGVCSYCASAFNVQDQIKDSGLSNLGEYNGHPSFRKLSAQGYQVLTF